LSDTYKTAKINFITSMAMDIIRSSYYIHGPWCDEINFCRFICQRSVYVIMASKSSKTRKSYFKNKIRSR